MKAYLIRQVYKTHVSGTLIFESGDVFHILERPWLDNASNVSCIPWGTYETSFLPRSGSGKYRKVWYLQNVVGRSGILIHNGNLVSHSRGCLLVGMRMGVLGGKPAVLGSRTALRKMNKLLNGKGFTLNIVGEAPC
jgi:hypothetical protein